ncbi:GATA-type zinc finger protein 1 [Archocentrus centrarchus]|uniref:GATA-type zinc finger protein 1 n=1 Tax=Archocentrus centrarchus TaxID=63155 RepID=UPI0011EA2859|nr:GATA-type zinc finger protein 1 [Archocentrus centrarchus]
MPCDELKKVSEECQSSKVAATLEPQSECNSPWKVLSLINLQCEKLLHQENPEELDPSSASSATKLGYSVAKSSTTAPHVIETGVRSGECMLGRSSRLFERQEITPSESVEEDVTGNPTGDSFKLQCSVKDSKMGVQLQTTEKMDTVRAELLKDSTSSSLHLQHRSKIDVNFSVNKQIECSEECKKDCSSSKQDVFDTILTLDHNANLTLSVESQCDNQLPPLSPIQPSSQSPSTVFSTAESSRSVSKQDECTDVPLEEEAPPAALIKSCASKAEIWTVQNEEIGSSSSHQWRTKTPRKQPHPSRSADIQDPDFQGVTFRIDTELDESREQCRLLITSKYSKELCKSVRKPRLRTRSSLKASSSDEENSLTNNVLKGKVCASCCTRKTPMWRDAEDGTPLCNACGIRYKKYRVRCVNCWHIPRKEGNSSSCCLKCGNFVRLTSAQRKDTT